MRVGCRGTVGMQDTFLHCDVYFSNWFEEGCARRDYRSAIPHYVGRNKRYPKTHWVGASTPPNARAHAPWRPPLHLVPSWLPRLLEKFVSGSMRIQCAWCRADLGEKEGEGVTHTICSDCVEAENEAIKRAMRKRAEARHERPGANHPEENENT